MATSYSVGHGMRRRSGISSNSLEAAGKSMARSHQTSEEATQAAAMAGSPRIPMGQAAPVLTGTLMPKHNTQAGDPTAGGKANRVNIEKIGATYRVQPKAMYMQLDPAAGPTLANARIIPSVAGRSNPNFEMGIQASEA
jgi:hypothetical protein